MWRIFPAVFLGAALCSTGLLSTRADDQKTPIPGGIEGKVKKVDVQAHTLTIVTSQGRERTFTVSDETTMVGPRGGKVRRRLHDPRFQDGMPLTVVADGGKATEIHLGYDRDSGDAAPARTPDRVDQANPPAGKSDQTPPKKATTPLGKAVAKGKAAATKVEEDEDNEVPGKVKSFDVERRILVVTLLNGKDRSFILPKDIKVLVKGAESRHGLEEPALKSGATIEVVTDESGRKVKELKIVPASQLKPKKAG